ncbi:MAG: hypothetical protein V7459_15905 [Oceanicoccus sp.]
MIFQLTPRGRLANALTPAIIVFFGVPSLQTMAQSVPSDLLEMSIEDLFEARVGDDSNIAGRDGKRWNFSYSYRKSRFSDYLDGSKKIPVRDVLFSPGEAPRTDKNFPVVPTDIEQEVHMASLRYDFTPDISVSVAIPYVKQSTDHVSIVPGYSNFIISTDGLGDITLLGSYRFAKTINSRWQAGLGISFPSGSIDEKGDTPRAPGKQQLPYTMQLGSGTYDVPAYLSYLRSEASFTWGVDLSAKIRLGENDRDYHLGNTVSASSWVRLTTISWIQPSIKLDYRHWTEIHGEDTSLTVPGPYPYPAPVVNPDLFGGDLVDLLIGLRIPVFSEKSHVDLEFGKPLYQSLNGPQSGEDYRFTVTFSGSF